MTSGGDATVDTIVSTVGLWWPDAEVEDLRASADAWERAAASLDEVGGRARPTIDRLVTAGEGVTADAVAQRWASIERDGLVPTAAGCRALADALRRYADEVEAAQHEIEVLAVEIGAGIVIGAATAWFTFGASAAVAGGIAARLVALAASIGVRVSNSVAAITATVLTGATFGAADAVAASTVVLAVRAGATGEGFSPAELGSAAAGGALGGGVVGGGLGGVASRALRHPAPGPELLRAPGGAIRAALDPTDWGPLGRAWRPGLREDAALLSTQERRSAQLYADEGAMVHSRPVRLADDYKNPDLLVRRGPEDPGIYAELKELRSPSSTAVGRNVREGVDQLRNVGGGEVVVDGRAAGLSEEAARAGSERALRNTDALGHEGAPVVRIVLGDGRTWIP